MLNWVKLFENGDKMNRDYIEKEIDKKKDIDREDRIFEENNQNVLFHSGDFLEGKTSDSDVDKKRGQGIDEKINFKAVAKDFGIAFVCLVVCASIGVFLYRRNQGKPEPLEDISFDFDSNFEDISIPYIEEILDFDASKDDNNKLKDNTGNISNKEFSGANDIAELVDFGYNLTYAGSIYDPDKKIGIRTDHVLVHREYDEEHNILDRFLTYLGDDIFDRPFEQIEYLGNGYFLAKEYSEEINSVGLITYEGEVIIPFNAAYIEKLSYDTDRYLKVTYSTGETENPDEAFFYTSENLNLLSAFNGYDDDDRFFMGYAKIFDMEQRKFVEGIELHNGMDATGCDDKICVEEKNGQGETIIYDSEGNILLASEKQILIGKDFCIISNGNAKQLCDYEGRVLFETSSGYLDRIGKDYVEFVDDGVKKVLNKNGEQVYNGEFDYINMQSANDMLVIQKDGAQKLVRLDGTELMASDNLKKFRYTYDGFGIWYYIDDDIYAEKRENGFINSEGKKVEISHRLDSLVGYNEDGEQKSLFVVSDLDCTLKFENANIKSLTKGLVTVEQNYQYQLYDLISGRKLLESEYDYIAYAADYIYALKDDTWQVFHLELNDTASDVIVSNAEPVLESESSSKLRKYLLLDGKVSIELSEDEYDVFEIDNTNNQLALERQGLPQEKVDLLMRLSGRELRAVPVGESLADSKTTLYVRIKPDTYPGLDNLRDLPQGLKDELAAALVSGFPKCDGYEWHSSDCADYIVFETVLTENETRYATIVDDSMIYIILTNSKGKNDEEAHQKLQKIVDTIEFHF